MITCNSLYKSYDGHAVITNFSYTFQDTGFYLLLGESGCGKTTLLNMLCGLIPFDGGSISYDEETYYDYVANAALGFVHYSAQDSFFVSYLTMEYNLKLCCTEDEKIDDLLAQFDLSGCKEKYPCMLSGGEKQRMAIIQALLHKKRILILDEPTASLDHDNKIKVLEMLQQLKDQVLILCSSHDKEMLSYADHCIDFSKPVEEIGGQEQRKNKAVQREQHTEPILEKISAYSFFKRQKKYPFREKKSKIVLFVVFCIAILVCLSCGNAEDKINSTIKYCYQLNQLDVIVKDDTFLQECRQDQELLDSVYSYYANVPLDANASTFVLPFKQDTFKRSDCLLFGSWYSDEMDILVSKGYAEGLSKDIQSLIGTKLQITLYDGKYEFRICGIIDELTALKQRYFDASGIDASTMIDSVFLNGNFVKRYEGNKEIPKQIEGGYQYQLYYSSFEAMRKSYEKYKDDPRVEIPSFLSIYTGEEYTFETLRTLLYPMMYVILALAIILYYQTQKTELRYTRSDLCVYLYHGYRNKEVFFAYWRNQICSISKLLLVALIVDYPIACFLNWLNHKKEFVSYQLFTWNYQGVVAFYLFVVGATTLLTFTIFRKVKVHGWFDMLEERRDLI